MPHIVIPCFDERTKWQPIFFCASATAQTPAWCCSRFQWCCSRVQPVDLRARFFEIGSESQWTQKRNIRPATRGGNRAVASPPKFSKIYVYLLDTTRNYNHFPPNISASCGPAQHCTEFWHRSIVVIGDRQPLTYKASCQRPSAVAYLRQRRAPADISGVVGHVNESRVALSWCI